MPSRLRIVFRAFREIGRVLKDFRMRIGNSPRGVLLVQIGGASRSQRKKEGMMEDAVFITFYGTDIERKCFRQGQLV